MRHLLFLVIICAPIAAAQNPKYGTYIGGSASSSIQYANSVLVDNSTGDYVICGSTNSSTYPVASAAQSTYGGGSNDGFVTDISATTGAIVWSTFLGGSSIDQVTKCTQDASGNIFVTGYTVSSNFPHPNGSAKPSGATAPFLAEYSPSGSLLFASVYGVASSTIHSYAVVLDGAGNAWLAGDTNHATNGGTDIWWAKVAIASPSTDTEFQYGGPANDTAYAVAFQGSTVYLGGYTLSSSGIATVGALNTSCTTQCTETPPSGECSNLACGEGFLATSNTSGVIQAATYLGGSGNNPYSANLSMEVVSSIAVDGSGNVFATGTTSNTDYPTTAGVLQTSFFGMRGTNSTKTAGCLGTYPGGLFRNGTYPCGDSFVSKLNSSLTTLSISTLVGSTNTDIAFSIILDGSGHPWIGGMTQWTVGGMAHNWPTSSNAYSTTGISGVQAFVTELSTTLASVIYSTYYPSGPDGWVYSVTLDGSGNPVFAGQTSASAAQGGSLPTTSNCFNSSGANTCHDLIGTNSAWIGVLTVPASQVNTPTISPLGPGPFNGSVSVTLSDSTGGSFICFTTDGSTPSTNEPTTNTCNHGTTYSSPVSISTNNTTLKAIAGASGLTDSSIAQSTYQVVNPPTIGGGTRGGGEIRGGAEVRR